MTQARPARLDWPVRLAITSDTSQIVKVRAVMREAAVRLGFEEPAVTQIALAVDEAIANVIQHGYESESGRPIEVTIEPAGERQGLQVTICDCGRRVDPATLAGRDLDDVRPGGLGVHIIRTVMDEVRYESREPVGMRLRMVKFHEVRSEDNLKRQPAIAADRSDVEMAEQNRIVQEVRGSGAATVVVLAGELDLHRTPEVHQALIAACEKKPALLVVNMEGVSYLDSSGIGTLVEIFRRVNGYGGKLALCGLNDRVHSVFEITKLDHFFKIFPTEDEALSA